VRRAAPRRARESPETRSRIMSAIRSVNTRPELAVRRAVWARGLRYRIHDRSVPGTPDLSNRSRRVAVFVDGCFWHACPRCYREPRSNVEFWRAKISRNRERRAKVRRMLRVDGWLVVQAWEHEVIRSPERVAGRVERAFQAAGPRRKGRASGRPAAGAGGPSGRRPRPARRRK